MYCSPQTLPPIIFLCRCIDRHALTHPLTTVQKKRLKNKSKSKTNVEENRCRNFPKCLCERSTTNAASPTACDWINLKAAIGGASTLGSRQNLHARWIDLTAACAPAEPANISSETFPETLLEMIAFPLWQTDAAEILQLFCQMLQNFNRRNFTHTQTHT